MKKKTVLVPRMLPDQWGRKLYLKRNGYEGGLKMISASHLSGLDWKNRTEAHLHSKTSHGCNTKRWHSAYIRGLGYRVKDWTFYNRIHDTNKTHGFAVFTL